MYGANTVTTIAGWGSDGVKSNYSILQKVNVPLVDGDICKRIFYRIRVRVITDVQVCAGELKKDSCKGLALLFTTSMRNDLRATT